jgi:hypothetical protein
MNNKTGGFNIGVGVNSLMNLDGGNRNVALGHSTGMSMNGTESNNTFVGASADGTAGVSNATAIGYGSTVANSNTIQLGNTSVTIVNTSGSLTAASYIKSGGTSSQFLKADGSLDSNTYLTSASGSSTYLPLAGGTLTGGLTGTAITGTTLTGTSFVKFGGSSSEYLMADGSVSAVVRDVDDEILVTTEAQTSFTLSQIPSMNSKVKMYINGIRISKNAYTYTTTSGIATVTYTASANGTYSVKAGDRIQFDYF